MSQSIRYLLDTDVFVSAKRSHYGFDFCPGFWHALLKSHELKRIHSVKPVREELLKGKDDLTDWVKSEPPTTFFKDVEDKAVVAAYGSVSQWVANNGQFNPAAVSKFLSGADPWLVAYAIVNGFVIASYEVSSAESRGKVKLPDVASQFRVTCIQPHEMLRELTVRLRLGKNSFK